MVVNDLQRDFDERFPEPTTLAECHERLLVELIDLDRIKMQLADPSRKDRMNLSDGQYEEWKKKANRARNMKNRHVSALDRWIKSQKTKYSIDSVKGENHVAMISKLVDAINDIRQRHHIPLTPSEHLLVSKADSIVSYFPAGS